MPGIPVESRAVSALAPEEIRAFASRSGIHAVGWFAASDFTEYLETVATAEAYRGIDYRPLETFLRAGRIPLDFRTVVVIVMDYYVEPSTRRDGYRLSNYSRACWSTVNPKIEALTTFLRSRGCRAENLDIPHRAAACRAGLGFIGKNSLFYARGLGSYVGIASIGTDAVLEGARVGGERKTDPACTACSRCVTACPVSAIPAEGYRIDPRRCLSFANRHPDEPLRVLPREGGKLQQWLHGCETCQNVCPLNAAAAHRYDAVVPPHLTLEGMTVPNEPVLSRGIIESRMPSLGSRGYRTYLEVLLAEDSATARPRSPRGDCSY